METANIINLIIIVMTEEKEEEEDLRYYLYRKIIDAKMVSVRFFLGGGGRPSGCVNYFSEYEKLEKLEQRRKSNVDDSEKKTMLQLQCVKALN